MNLDPEFSRMLTRVMTIGGVIGLVGAGVLVLAFRAHGSQTRDFRAVVLTAIVLVFVMVACVVLLMFSRVR